MNTYEVFGGRLDSELELPELAAVEPGPATWRLRIAVGVPNPSGDEPLGAAAVDEGVEARLFRTRGGYRLEYDDTGSYVVNESGSEIVWYPKPGASRESAQLDLLGRVLALAFHASGAYCLHASAAALGGGAVGFMAPKFHGKSTTAFALVRAGARLITDDMLVISTDDPPQVRPGIHTVRLWEDSAVAASVGAVDQIGAGGKVLVCDLPGRQLVLERLPLSALYLLAPFVADGSGRGGRRVRLSSTQAAVLLVAHAKIGGLLGGTEAPALFRMAATLAARVPVYRLEVPRDFERLPEVVAALQGWHESEDPGDTERVQESVEVEAGVS